MHFPSKKAIIFLSIFFVILLTFVLFYLSVVSSKTVSARLLVEEGNVFVNDKEVFGDYILEEKDKISTSSKGMASVILYESIVVSLEPNTVIVVEDLAKSNPRLYQEKGETWNQFTKLFGVKAYDIRTSTSVASVRGTGFLLSDSFILVEEGKVDFDIDNNSYLVEEGNAVERFGEIIRERELTEEEIQKLKEKKLRTIQSLKELRRVEIAKHPKIVGIIKEKYDFSDEDIEYFLQEVDEGRKDLNDFKEDVPIRVDSVEKIIEITEKIRELNSSL